MFCCKVWFEFQLSELLCQLSAFVVNFDNAAHSGFSFFCVLDVVVFIYVSHMLLHVKFHQQILGFCCCVARYETTLNCLGIKQLSFYRGGCHGRLVSSSSLLYVPPVLPLVGTVFVCNFDVALYWVIQLGQPIM